jgi:2-polyprenyl-3-methyl-5-hydroxy-6-metoxy-1,4-benzoquinol methylase
MQCPLCKTTPHLTQNVCVEELVDLWNRSEIDVKRIFDCDVISKYSCEECGLGFYYPFFPGDDEFYGRLALWEWYYKHPGKTEYDLAANLVSPGMSIIDVGCGIGEFSRFLPVDVHFLGVELSSKSVGIANSLGRNVKLIDINNAPDEFYNQYDMVTCFQVLEHIVEVDIFFSSLIKLCKPGGIIVVAVPNNDGFVGSAVNNLLNMPPHHILLWNEKSLKFLATKYHLIINSYIEERLTSIHREWFFSVIIRKFLMRLISKPYKVIDHNRTLLLRLLNKVTFLLSRMLSFISPKLNQPGHSSIIVFKKPAYEEIL